MSNLIEHARRELELSGVDNDIYGDMTSKAVLELVEVFSKQGHSGMSGSLVLQLFTRVARFENLTALTDNPEEWIHHNDNLWQNKRNSACFSTDGGKTYKNNDEIERNEDGTYRRNAEGGRIQPTHTSVSYQKEADK